MQRNAGTSEANLRAKRMLIALHDSDHTGFPNYALMKISAWHKAQGDTVEWFMPLGQYGRVYSSKVFTFTPEDPYLPPDTVKGGTGYGIYDPLPDEIDDMFPDYSIYPDCHYAIGFLTRGCIRACPWCVVPRKEGKIRPYRTWQQIKRQDSRDIVLMDNNVLACPWGVEQLESMVGQDVRIDTNQGLDSRLVTPEIAKILSKLKWIRFIRTACDTDASMESVGRMIELLNMGGGETISYIRLCAGAGRRIGGAPGAVPAKARCPAIRTALPGFHHQRRASTGAQGLCPMGQR